MDERIHSPINSNVCNALTENLTCSNHVTGAALRCTITLWILVAVKLANLRAVPDAPPLHVFYKRSQTLVAHAFISFRPNCPPWPKAIVPGSLSHLRNPIKPYLAVVGGDPFTSVRQQVNGIYASEHSQRGVIALAIDYRSYGESGGAVRQHKDLGSKPEDFSAALRVLVSCSDFAGTGILGICTAAGKAL
ncbi:hypothetical protein LTR53_008908 [Teratosphaeriaceae sp. CCFEE 6253]|nr:hypothetical protein LTR53_008908 [Teratosphaeriaceae sp. CCFEE 6253]